MCKEWDMRGWYNSHLCPGIYMREGIRGAIIEHKVSSEKSPLMGGRASPNNGRWRLGKIAISAPMLLEGIEHKDALPTYRPYQYHIIIFIVISFVDELSNRTTN